MRRISAFGRVLAKMRWCGGTTDAKWSEEIRLVVGELCGKGSLNDRGRASGLRSSLPQWVAKKRCACHPTRAWTARTWRTVHPEAPSSPRSSSRSLFGGQCEHSLRVREFSDKERLQAAPLAEPFKRGRGNATPHFLTAASESDLRGRCVSPPRFRDLRRSARTESASTAFAQRAPRA